MRRGLSRLHLCWGISSRSQRNFAVIRIACWPDKLRRTCSQSVFPLERGEDECPIDAAQGANAEDQWVRFGLQAQRWQGRSGRGKGQFGRRGRLYTKSYRLLHHGLCWAAKPLQLRPMPLFNVMCVPSSVFNGLPEGCIDVN